jgi:hypothetical protein
MAGMKDLCQGSIIRKKQYQFYENPTAENRNTGDDQEEKTTKKKLSDVL